MYSIYFDTLKPNLHIGSMYHIECVYVSAYLNSLFLLAKHMHMRRRKRKKKRQKKARGILFPHTSRPLSNNNKLHGNDDMPVCDIGLSDNVFRHLHIHAYHALDQYNKFNPISYSEEKKIVIGFTSVS